MHARGNAVQLGQLMITATRYGSFILLLIGLPLIFIAKGILSVWVGSSYAVEGVRILQVLTAANIIRLSAVPYVTVLVGTGQQKLVTLTPLLEGMSNLIASVIGGLFLGAIGVAIGTLIGGIVGVMGNLFYNMPRTLEIRFRIADYLRDGLLRPVVCAVPIIVTALTFHFSSFAVPAVNYATFGIAVLATAFLIWRFGMVGSEREKLRTRNFVPEG
jgi:O-antigen/teichoic acid export membrane protein